MGVLPGPTGPACLVTGVCIFLTAETELSILCVLPLLFSSSSLPVLTIVLIPWRPCGLSSLHLRICQCVRPWRISEDIVLLLSLVQTMSPIGWLAQELLDLLLVALLLPLSAALTDAPQVMT